MYITLNQIKTYFSSALLAVILCLFSQSALADIKCGMVTPGNMQSAIVPSSVSIPTDNLTPDREVWHSELFSMVLTCSGIEPDSTKRSVYVNLDPKGDIARIDPSLKIVVETSHGNQQVAPNNTIYLGTLNCTMTNGVSKCPILNLFLTYTIYIKTTGKNPPDSGNITSSGSYVLFNVGQKNDNSTNGSSAYATLSGLNNIHFTACKPQINVVANNGAAMDFGRIEANNAQAGKTEKQIPFSVQANLTGANLGQDCQGKMMSVSFSSNNFTHGNDTIVPSDNSPLGISISPASAANSFIPLKTNVDLGYVNGSVANNNFIASLRWVSNAASPGGFHTTANVDVTFK